MQTDINAAYFKSIIDQDRCSVVIRSEERL